MEAELAIFTVKLNLRMASYLSIIMVTSFFYYHLSADDHSDDKNSVARSVDDDDDYVINGRVVNFASVSAGAIVLESSPKSVGFRNLLSDDRDKYV